MSRVLLQMAGESGTGKSTPPRAVGRATGAVVDRDIVKSRLLDGEAEIGLAGLPEALAGPLHHALLFDLARTLLDQGFSVVLDGAAFYPFVRRRGRKTAAAAGAAYVLIERCLPDIEARQARIDAKTLLSSQPSSASFSGDDRPKTEPLSEPHRLLDTSRSLDCYLNRALACIRHDQG